MSSLSVAIGTFQNEYRCNKCGFESMFFPEIEMKKKNTKKKS